MSIVFKAPTRFDADEIKKLRHEFDRLAAGGDDVIVDLARTEIIDGSGVGALVFTFKRLVASGNRLTVRNISGQPLELLNAADLLRTLSGETSGGLLRDVLHRFGWQKPRSAMPSAAVIATLSPDRSPTRQDIEQKKGAA